MGFYGLVSTFSCSASSLFEVQLSRGEPLVLIHIPLKSVIQTIENAESLYNKARIKERYARLGLSLDLDLETFRECPCPK